MMCEEHCHRILFPSIALLAVLLPVTAGAEDMADFLEERTGKLRERINLDSAQTTSEGSGSVRTTEEREDLLRVIDQGEHMNISLRAQVAAFRSEKESLRIEKEELLKTQRSLTNGLIGAVLTALIALIGAVFGFVNSRPARDLKKIEIIEKIRELEQRNVEVPSGIRRMYLRDI